MVFCLFTCTNQCWKIKSSVKNFFSKCEQIRIKLRVYSHLLNKSLTSLLCRNQSLAPAVNNSIFRLAGASHFSNFNMAWSLTGWLYSIQLDHLWILHFNKISRLYFFPQCKNILIYDTIFTGKIPVFFERSEDMCALREPLRNTGRIYYLGFI